MATADVTDGSEWQVGKSLADCLLYMLEQEIDCDVTFSVNFEDDPPQQISAHKLLLKARSPVFQKMFSGSLIDSDVVNISDMKATTLKETLQYMYSEESSLSGSNVMKILYSANKYKLQLLADTCVAYLEANLDHDNVCTILTDALGYKKEELIETCLTYISKNTQNVLGSEGFLELSHAALWKIVQEPRLPADLEGKLYERCVEWAKHQGAKTDQEIRNLMGDCINHICFLSLTTDEFTRIAQLSDILTANEKAEIIFFLLSKNPIHRQKLKDIGLSTKTRIIAVTRIDNSGLSGPLQLPASVQESFTITPNANVMFCGISVYVGDKGSESDVNITVVHNDTNLNETTVKVVSGHDDGIGNTMDVLVEKPVQLQAGSLYTIKVQVNSTGKVISPFSCMSLRSFNIHNATTSTTTESWALTRTVTRVRTRVEECRSCVPNVILQCVF